MIKSCHYHTGHDVSWPTLCDQKMWKMATVAICVRSHHLYAVDKNHSAYTERKQTSQLLIQSRIFQNKAFPHIHRSHYEILRLLHISTREYISSYFIPKRHRSTTGCRFEVF